MSRQAVVGIKDVQSWELNIAAELHAYIAAILRKVNESLLCCRNQKFGIVEVTQARVHLYIYTKRFVGRFWLVLYYFPFFDI